MHHNVAAGLLVRYGQVLLCHRHPSRSWYPDVWDMPGGHIELGETPADALRRELAEEIGVSVILPNDEPWSVLHPAVDLTLNVWIIEQWHGVVENVAPDEHDLVGWFGPRQAERLNLVDAYLMDLISEATART